MEKVIIQLGDERLNQISEPIKREEFGSDSLKQLADDLIDTCISHIREAAGLSAVQIGILKRIFVVRRIDLEDKKKSRAERKKSAQWEVMVNPEITYKSEQLNLEWEGCMSISAKNKRLFGPVSRPESIEIKYFDLEGNEHELVAHDFFSSLIQHEVDHLNGVLFLKYISNPANIWNEDELNSYIEKNNKMPPIKK